METPYERVTDASASAGLAKSGNQKGSLVKLAKKIQNTPSMQIYNQKVGRPKFADPTRISAKPTDK